jgi:hypothetical protein
LSHEGPDRLGVLKRLFQINKLLLGWGELRLFSAGQRLDILSNAQGKHVELVVKNETGVAAAKGEDETLIKAGNRVLV